MRLSVYESQFTVTVEIIKKVLRNIYYNIIVKGGSITVKIVARKGWQCSSQEQEYDTDTVQNSHYTVKVVPLL